MQLKFILFENFNVLIKTVNLVHIFLAFHDFFLLGILFRSQVPLFFISLTYIHQIDRHEE